MSDEEQSNLTMGKQDAAIVFQHVEGNEVRMSLILPKDMNEVSANILLASGLMFLCKDADYVRKIMEGTVKKIQQQKLSDEGGSHE